jgi:hypothetical protein
LCLGCNWNATSPTYQLACWQSANFNTTSCAWDVTGTQPAQPTNLACWQSALQQNFLCLGCNWNATSPTYQLGLLAKCELQQTSCAWDVTGTQPVQPTGLACWQSANFNTTFCAWDITGTQPVQPTGLACWQSANFNTTSCAWDVTGTQPAQPTGLACWQSANFNTTSCSWDVTGTQPAQPTGLACWQSANFQHHFLCLGCNWNATSSTNRIGLLANC